MSRYLTARERLSVETRREIASHAARARHEHQRTEKIVLCRCGDPENVHWSVGNRECRACDMRESPNACTGFTPLK